MFSTWNIVRPNVWAPLAAMEQSMMDLELMHEVMMSSHFPLSNHQLLSVPDEEEEEEFFKGLPISSAEEARKMNQGKSKKHQKANKKSQRAFSSYSYSSSSVINDNGERVETTRRRYEDSNGRLKAQHVRKIGDKACISSWNRQNKGDDGEHKAHVNHGSVEEFDKLWELTAFGTAFKDHKLEAEVKQRIGSHEHEERGTKVKPSNSSGSNRKCTCTSKCQCGCICHEESPTKKLCTETCQYGGKGTNEKCHCNCAKQGETSSSAKDIQSPKTTLSSCDCSQGACCSGSKVPQKTR